MVCFFSFYYLFLYHLSFTICRRACCSSGPNTQQRLANLEALLERLSLPGVFPTQLLLSSQEGLQLTGQQKQQLLSGRKALLERLNQIAAQRRDTLAQLGLHLLQLPQVNRCNKFFTTTSSQTYTFTSRLGAQRPDILAQLGPHLLQLSRVRTLQDDVLCGTWYVVCEALAQSLHLWHCSSKDPLCAMVLDLQRNCT